jgi:hypothetical protein
MPAPSDVVSMATSISMCAVSSLDHHVVSTRPSCAGLSASLLATILTSRATTPPR